MVIDSFADLERLLRKFSAWEERGGYDYGGVVCLLAACLDNLREHAVEDELNELRSRLDDGQITFLLRVAEIVRDSGDE